MHPSTNRNAIRAPINRLPFSVPLIVLFWTAAWGQEPPNPRNLLPGDGITSVKTLEQHWSDAESRAFYNAPQGSQLLPYRWFLFLEQPGNNKRFLDPEHIRSLGYLPRSPDGFGNEDGLPIGFVRDMPFRDGTPALGMTCAACHTTQINHNNVAWLIDGAPTLGDIETLQRRLQAALKATIEDQNKFARFAAKVLATPSEPAEAKLRQDLQHFEALRRLYNERNLSKEGTTPQFGYGRMDAFGAILNEVTVTSLHRRDNWEPADAPVSFPFLWDTPQHDFVQWNGIAENEVNSLAGLVLGTPYIGALARNTIEVLGAFGNASVDLPTPIIGGYASSVDRPSLIRIEDSLRELWSPLLPTELRMNGRATNNAASSDAGKLLFNEYCAACHTNNGEEYKFDRMARNRRVEAKMKAVGTDVAMYLNVALRRPKTGLLEGRPAGLFSLFDRLQAEEPVERILKHIVPRIMLGPNFDMAGARQANILAALEVPMSLALSFQTPEGLLTGNFTNVIQDGGPAMFLVTGDNIRFTPKKGEQSESAAMRLYIVHAGNVKLRNSTATFDAADFKTLSDFKTLARVDPTVMAWATESTVSQLRVSDAKIVVKYKARPLNGIWATAPYLHNGSVPNLYELLLPASERSKEFWVGRRDFDTTRIGFESGPGDGLFRFDTTIPGNLNTGHEYGPKSDAGDRTPADIEKERWQLVEYIKGL